jgi:hypothetical protein
MRRMIAPYTRGNEVLEEVKSYEKEDGPAKVERFLKEQRANLEVKNHPDSNSNSSESFSDDDISDVEDASMTELQRATTFMVSSLAFASLRKNLRDFVFPSFKESIHHLIDDLSRSGHRDFQLCSKYDLRGLVTELQHIQPSQISIAYKEDTGLTDYIKGWIEDRTCEEWEWWPFKPRLRALSPKDARLRWTCVSCGRLAPLQHH